MNCWLRGWALVLGFASSLNGSILITDDFNDNVTDPAVWAVNKTGSGAEIAEMNGRLEVFLSATAQGGEFSASYYTVAFAAGDFDERVDYDLLQWPSQSGVRVGIGMSVGFGVTERIGFGISDVGSGEHYLTHFLGGITSKPTTDTQGSLRLVREGSILTGYFWSISSQGWEEIASGSAPAGSVHLALSVWSDDRFFRDSRCEWRSTISGPRFVPHRILTRPCRSQARSWLAC